MKIYDLRSDLACPVCKFNSLVFEADTVRCPDCNRVYPIEVHNGQSIINFIPDSHSLFKNPVQKLWQHLLGTSSHKEEGLLNDVASFQEYDAGHTAYNLSRGKILDVGGGSGILRRCIKNAAEYIDIEPDIDAYERRKLLGKIDSRLNNPFSFVCGIAEYLPFRSMSFDSVVMDGMIEHVFNISFSFAEAQRVLKKGGKLYLSADCRGIEVKSMDISLFKKIFNYIRKNGPLRLLKRILSRIIFNIKKRINPWRDILDFSQSQMESGHIYDNLKKDDILNLGKAAGFSKIESSDAGKGTVFILTK